MPIESVYDTELQIGLQQLMSVGSAQGANEMIINKKLDSIFELAESLRLMRNVGLLLKVSEMDSIV